MRNQQRNLAKLSILIGSAITIVSFQNCSKAAFNIDPQAKQSALDNGTVFGPTGATDSFEYPDQSSNTPDDSDNTPDSASYSTISVTPRAVCGPKMGSESMSTVGSVSKIVAVLYKSSMGSLLAEAKVVQVWDSEADSKKFKEQLVSSKSIDFSLSAPLSEGVYGVVFWDASKAKSPYKYSMSAAASAVAPIADSVAQIMDNNSVIRVGKDGKIQGKQQTQLANVLVGFEGDAVCDEADKIDPLLLQLNTKSPKPIALTAPEHGVMFDLLGSLNSHKPVKTAWFASTDTENYFLVLPNGQGKVLGINELFGDATLGPDQKFAKQGFAALAKWDENRDRVISPEDSVFTSLKLWKDDNLDGIAQASELHSLDEKGVVAIDLKYDRRYKEVDQHGNVVRYKSVVVMKDNSYGLVYDLYLRFIK